MFSNHEHALRAAFYPDAASADSRSGDRRGAGPCGRAGGFASTSGVASGNRLRTIQASLAIENNSLTLEQVTAVIAGKRVLGPPKEIQEVRNAFAAYEAMENWKPWAAKDLMKAHHLLMAGLVDRPGKFRSGGVGIAQGEDRASGSARRTCAGPHE